MKLVSCLVISCLLVVTSSRYLDERSRHTKQENNAMLMEIEKLLIEILQEELGDKEAVSAWMETANKLTLDVQGRLALAEWNLATNITKENEEKETEVSVESSRLDSRLKAETDNLNLKHVDKDVRRQVDFYRKSAVSKRLDISRYLAETTNKMTSIYNTGKVCTVSGRPCLTLEPDLTYIMSQSRDPEQLLQAWVGWHQVNRPMKPLYEQFVALKNMGAVENGYTDYGEYWRDELFGDTPDLEEMAATLWKEVEPLYKQLHAYVRSKLRDFYGDDVVSDEDGTIPAHILGNMWGQNWAGVYEIVKPYNTTDTNRRVEDKLKEKYDVKGLFRLAEDFYSSIGLFNMTDTFWNKSMLTKPSDREVQCHASAFDLYRPGDFRIKMCSEVNLDYFQTIHHEMGHVEYYMAYESQPVVYRNGANSAFHEAVGDTIALSVRSRKHLETIGLLDADIPNNEESDINTLLLHALNKVAFLPFGYLVDKWRYDVFRGEVTRDEYNEKWWDLRYEYQGISPPVQRTKYDFDPGAKFHIPSNSPYISYFFSFILQFQFYQRMCELSGHQGELHTCDFYGSEEAGKQFREMLSLGSSVPWPEALERFTGSREVSAKPLLEYFQPLMDWLEDVNDDNEEVVGW